MPDYAAIAELLARYAAANDLHSRELLASTLAAGATASAASSSALELTKTFASQSFTMYSISLWVSLDDRHVKRRPERWAAHSNS